MVRLLNIIIWVNALALVLSSASMKPWWLTGALVLSLIAATSRRELVRLARLKARNKAIQYERDMAVWRLKRYEPGWRPGVIRTTPKESRTQ